MSLLLRGLGKARYQLALILVHPIEFNIHVGATFLSVSGAELFSPYVGDSEKAIVELFRSDPS
jgi:SpoVK/Ycf46/Vps4 family AAA+-type ATPase